MPFIVRSATGDWESSLTLREVQNQPFETYNCTGFNTLHQIQTYMKLVFGITANYSDRWLGIIAGTKPPGNDPQVVFEAIRKYGLVLEETLPFSDDLNGTDDYYSFKGADEAACRAEGLKWLEKFSFNHEWVVKPGMKLPDIITAMKSALTTSPLTFAVFAWGQDGDGLYVKEGEENHWTLCYRIDQLVKVIQKVYDSYDPTMKDVCQQIDFCKRIYIEMKPQPAGAALPTPVTPLNPWSFITKIINFIKSLKTK